MKSNFLRFWLILDFGCSYFHIFMGYFMGYFIPLSTKFVFFLLELIFVLPNFIIFIFLLHIDFTIYVCAIWDYL